MLQQDYQNLSFLASLLYKWEMRPHVLGLVERNEIILYL